MTPKKRNWTIAGVASAAVTSVVAFLALSGPTVVPAGASLQQYINNASAGTELQLEAGATFDCNCVLRSEIEIDGQGSAKIRTPNAAPALDVPPGTRNITVRNVDITTINPAQLTYDIVRVGTWQTTDLAQVPVNVTFDNVRVYGQSTQDVQRGIAANGINVSVTNSRITEIHGRGMETQGIAAWNTPGPLNFHNNHVEAATEGIMIGGADSSLCTSRDAQGKCVQGVVADGVRITRNRIVKPLSWYRNHPTYAGIHWPVKNLLEVKAGKNVIIDGNILENCWGDAQIGFAMLITVRNQDGTNPWNVIENVSITNNTISNVAGGFQVLGKDSPNISQQSSGLRIANNVITLATNLGGNGRLLQLQGFHNVTFESNEANPHHTFMNLTGTNPDGSTTISNGLIYRNNLVAYGEYGLFTDAAKPIASYAPGAVITGSYIYNSPVTSGLPGNSYFAQKPTTIPAGVGVDYAALQAAQAGTSPSPSVTPTVTISPSPVLSPSPAPTAPPAEGPSENNTRIPTATKIVDDKNAVWTLSGVRMLRNGQDTGGYGSVLLWCQGRIYGKGEDLKWWQYTNPGWAQFGPDPCTSASPTPAPSPTATATPTPTVTPNPSPTPKPSPQLPACTPNQIIGNPARCICFTGVRCTGGNARCQ